MRTHHRAARVLPCAQIFPINYLQVFKTWLGVGGACREALQVALLRQYLDYSDASRKRIGHTGFIQALLRDTVEIVDNGYMRTFDAAGSLGMILCLCLWSAREVPAILPLMMLLPIFMLIRLASVEHTGPRCGCRGADQTPAQYTLMRHCDGLTASLCPSCAAARGAAIKLRLKYFKAQGHMLSHADDVIDNLSLVRDYQRRPIMAKRMTSLVDDVNYFSNAVQAYTIQSKLIVPASAMIMYWLVMAASPAVMAYGGVSAGRLLAALNAMQTMGKESEKLFDALINIQLSVSALLRVAHCMKYAHSPRRRIRRLCARLA